MKKWTNTRSDGPGEVIAFTSTYDWGTYFRVSFDGTSYTDAEEDSKNWGMSINKYIAIAKKHNATVEKYIRVTKQTATLVRFKKSDDANDFLEELRRKMHATKLMNTE